MRLRREKRILIRHKYSIPLVTLHSTWPLLDVNSRSRNTFLTCFALFLQVFGKDKNSYQHGVTFPQGSKGTFYLNANHEMLR